MACGCIIEQTVSRRACRPIDVLSIPIGARFSFDAPLAIVALRQLKSTRILKMLLVLGGSQLAIVVAINLDRLDPTLSL